MINDEGGRVVKNDDRKLTRLTSKPYEHLFPKWHWKIVSDNL